MKIANSHIVDNEATESHFADNHIAEALL